MFLISTFLVGLSDCDEPSPTEEEEQTPEITIPEKDLNQPPKDREIYRQLSSLADRSSS